MSTHLFVSESGDLFDTRRKDWSSKPLRKGFSRTYARITNGRELRASIRAGGFAFPGGYPIVFVTSDGEFVSPSALAKDKSALYQALHDVHYGFSGRIVAADIYHEGEPVQCAYTNETIESAYGSAEE